MENLTGALGATGAAGGRGNRYRYLVVAVIWATFFFGAFDRSTFPLLLVDPGFLRDMGLEGSPEKQGLLMTLLFLPYAFSNILLSFTADRFGPRKVLTLMMGLWAAAAIWMGAIGSYSMMLVGRMVRGTAEGPLFPVANRYIRYWFPPSERGGANAIWTSGQRIGMALAVPLLTMVIGMWSWRFALFLQAAIILLLVLPAIWFLTADAPEKMIGIAAPEVEYIRNGRGGDGAISPGQDGALSGLLHNYRFWLMVIYHFAVLATHAGLLTWLPKYLREVRGFDLGQMVLFVSLPYLGSFLSSLVFGFLSDRIGRRAVLCALSQAGTAVAIGLAAIVPDSIASALLIILAMIMWGMGPPIFFAIMQRIIPGPIMATGIGIDNGIANFGAALAPVVVGFLIAATGSYIAGLFFLAALGLIGAGGAMVLSIQKY